MKKWVCSIFVVLAMLLSFIPIIHAAEIVASGNCGVYNEDTGDYADNAKWTLDSNGTLTLLCENMKIIYIPSSLRCIYDRAFWGCLNLDNVYFNWTEEMWNNIDITCDYGNDCFLNAKFNFLDSIPAAQITSAKYTNATGNSNRGEISVNMQDVAVQSTMYCAIYNSDGTLSEVSTESISAGMTDVSFDTNSKPKGGKAVIYLWIDGMQQPIADKYTLSL